MSLVIKAADSAPVRAFRNHDDAALSAADAAPQVDPRDAEIEALVREKEALARRLDDAAAERAEAIAKAAKDGWQEGHAACERDEAARLDALRQALATALQAWHERLDEWETLAVLLGKAALEKIFADDSRNAELVAAAIQSRTAGMRRDVSVTIRVSAEDFPDEASLARAFEDSGSPAFPIILCPTLGSGECTVDLQLGQVDVTPRQQWHRLEALLDRILVEESAA